MHRRWTAIVVSIVAFGLVTMSGVLLVFRPVEEVDTISSPWPPSIAVTVYLVLSVFLLDWTARRMRSSYSAAFVIAAAQSIFIVDLLSRGERGLVTAAAGIAILAISWASVAFVHSWLTPKPPGLNEEAREVLSIIPTVRCSNMRESLAFYTDVLGFERVDGDDDLDDPAFSVLSRAGDRLFLSSHRGDGEYGQAIVVEAEDVDREWSALRHRGLRPPGNPSSPVHEGPIDQTWGTREFYVDDPDGNTLRFVQTPRS